jgi:hypothetical protein
MVTEADRRRRRNRQLADLIRELIDSVQGHIERAAKRMPPHVIDDRRLRDNLERTIDDVSDDRVQAELRRLLADLDEHAEDRTAFVERTLSRENAYASFEPLRVLAKDLEGGSFDEPFDPKTAATPTPSNADHNDSGLRLSIETRWFTARLEMTVQRRGRG